MRALLVVAEDAARTIEAALVPLGYEVARVEPAAAAATHDAAALVVADWDALGESAARDCRALQSATGATLLVLCRDRSPGAIAAALAAGAADVLGWPEEAARLIARARLAARDDAELGDTFTLHPLPTWIFDVETLELLAVNDAAVRSYGWTREELLGMTLRDVRPPALRAALRAQMKETPPDGGGKFWTHWRKDGSLFEVEVVWRPLRFRGRNARIASVRDVSAHLRASAAHQQSASEHLAFLERLGDGVFIYRIDTGDLVYANPALCRFLDYPSSEELCARPGLELVPPDERPLVLEHIRALTATATRSTAPSVTRFIARDGTIRLAETRGVSVTYDGARAVTVIVRDLSDRQRTDEALRLSEERFSKIFHANPAAITVTRLSDDTFIDVNERFVAMTGFAREEVIGHTGVELGLWQAPESRAQLDDAIRAGRKVRDVEVHLVKKSGEPLDLLMSLETFSVGGEPCVFALSHDITERKQLEQQLRHAQKMDAVGRLAGGVAHDFNNLLTAIRGYAQLLVERLAPESEERDAAVHIQRSALRASSLTAQLLVFTRRQPHQPRVIALNETVQSMATLLRRLIGEDIELTLDLQADLGWVRVDPGQIEQVLLNLAVNARDAMARGGKLSIATDNSVDSNGAHVRLTVRDTGEGMNEETKLRIFEPFFTTKEVGKGTGLGLSIVYGVVVQNGGSISVDSAPGAGTVFRILLPRVDEPAEAETPVPPPKSVAQRGRETILLVEDDEDVRDFVEFVLRQSGYEVLTAANGSVALEIAREHAGPIHLLLSDVVMPQMTGVDLAERLMPLRPTMRVVHMSGYPGDRITRHGQMPAGVPFLQKPFSAEALNGVIRAVLDGH